jgi:two-component system, sensor histidine kinase
LRNPLSALTSAAYLLKIAGSTGKAAEHARGVIERQTRHMTRLIEDLLDINRVAMGKATLIREPLDLADLVTVCVRTWRESERLNQHSVVVNAAPAWIEADRSRIEQVFSNLLENALKFTPGGKQVTVTVRQDGPFAVLEVADEGEGIDPAMLGRIFGLFVQGAQEIHRPSGGLGVGLALVKGLVELHGGTVTAQSKGRGHGTVFTVRLPLTTVTALSGGESAFAVPDSGDPRRILIVEDNHDARQMLRGMLELGGHTVSEAEDAASAQRLATAEPPDVMIVDIGLPDFDGYELAARIRALPAGDRILLIALTGYGQAEDKKRAVEAGFDAHATKPVLPEQLAELIESASRTLKFRVA